MRVADEAFALDGARAAETYLDIGKLLDVARRSGADAVHPGYGFLAENAGFAQAVIDAGLIWIGPAAVGHRRARRQGQRAAHRAARRRPAGRRAPPTRSPASREIHAFAAEHGLPVAIKAAFGGGGRGLKVARDVDEIDEMFESAVREAVAAFGRGECFVERYLDRPRHVETQCLADAARHGRRRLHARLLAAAPAPEARRGGARAVPHRRAERPARRVVRRRSCARPATSAPGRASSSSAADGTISFLEVNTRLQVEHPVTEEVSGIDLVREQLRIAAGEPLGYDHVADARPLDRVPHQRRGPGARASCRPRAGSRRCGFPAGPGVRVDSGVVEGDSVSGAVRLDDRQADRHRRRPRRRPSPAPAARSPSSRSSASRRSSRSTARCSTPRRSRPPTRRSRSRCTPAGSRPSSRRPSPRSAPRRPPRRTRTTSPRSLERVVVEVGGKRLEVVLPAALALGRGPGGPAAGPPARPRADRSVGPPAPTAAATAPRSPRRCRARSSRSPWPRARRWPRATSSSCSRR